MGGLCPKEDQTDEADIFLSARKLILLEIYDQSARMMRNPMKSKVAWIY